MYIIFDYFKILLELVYELLELKLLFLVCDLFKGWAVFELVLFAV